MKLPERPIDWKKAFEEKGEKTFKLIRDRNILEKVLGFNRRYLYWSELEYRTRDSEEQKNFWTLMKLLRSERYEKIAYKSVSLKYVNLPEINKHLHKFDKFLAGNIGFQDKKLALQERYIISSLMEEAIASSIIEGAATTRKAAKEMLRQKRKPRNKSEKMVLNGYETMQMIVKRKDEKLTPEFLLEIQADITKETLEDENDVGKLRDNNDTVVRDDDNGNIYHIPPDFKDIDRLINEFCSFANNDEGEFMHPIIKGIVLHFLIGYIHPFNDGNGRTARSVFYWYVLSRGYWLFEFMAVSRRILRSKKDYGLAYLYTEYDEMDLTYFIKFNLTCVDDSLNDLLKYIELKQKEQYEVQKIVGSIKGINVRQAAVLEDCMKNPEKYYTIQEISGAYNVVYQTARTDLLLLTKLGYLTMKKISKRFVFKLNPERKEDKGNQN